MELATFKLKPDVLRPQRKLLAEGARAFVLFDEMFKGTNVKDAMDASGLVLDGFARGHRSTVVISSHLVELAELFADHRRIAFRAFEARHSQRHTCI